MIILNKILQIAESMADKPRKVSYSDEVTVELRKELVNLREEVARLHKEDETRQQKSDSIEKELKELRSAKNMNLEVAMLKEKLMESRFKETRSRVSKEFISTQLVLRNATNKTMVNQIQDLEKEIEKLEANEEEKLQVLQKQKEALAKAWKEQSNSKPDQHALSKAVGLGIDEILLKYHDHLVIPDETKIETILSEAQDNIATIVIKSGQLLDHARLQNVRRNEESDEEIVVTMVKKLTRKRKFHNLSWNLVSETTTIRAPEEERIGDEIPVPPRPVSPQLGNLNDLLRSLREDRASNRDQN